MPFFFCAQSHSSFSTLQAATRCCRIVFHAGSPAERQLFRTDFRFAPSPRRASLAGPPIHVTRDMVVHGLCGRVPDSAGNVSMDCICSDRRKSVGPSAPIAYATSVSPPDEAVAWPWCRYPMGDKATAWPGAAFLQITARANPCSRHLWGTLARAVASI